MGSYAFSGCSNLTTVTISGSVGSYVGSYAFSGCSNLTTATISGSVGSYVGSYAFSGCSSLASVIISGSVVQIDDNAFLGCTGLKTLILEDDENHNSLKLGNKTINKYENYGLFVDCPIEDLYLGRSIKYIHDGGKLPFQEKAFKNITLGRTLSEIEGIDWVDVDVSITIYSLNPEPPKPLDAFTISLYSEAQVFVPAGALAAYKADPDWGPFIHMQEIGMSDISSVQTASELGVKAEDGRIKVENANGRVDLYDISGRLLDSAEADGGCVEIAVPKRGVYIVKVGKQMVKVAM